MKGNLEKRRYPRLEKNLPIKIRAQDFDIVTQTKNISAIGVYCQLDKYIAPMTHLSIVLLLPVSAGKVTKIQCEGIVARITEITQDKELAYNIAIFLNDISDKNINKISKYIMKHLSEKQD